MRVQQMLTRLPRGSSCEVPLGWPQTMLMRLPRGSSCEVPLGWRPSEEKVGASQDAPPIWLPSHARARGASIGNILAPTTVLAPPIVLIVVGAIEVPRGFPSGCGGLLEVLPGFHLIELPLLRVRTPAHVQRTRALTPGLTPRDERCHPDLMRPAMRRFQRFPIRCSHDHPIRVLLHHLPRNRKRAPAPMMRHRQ